MADIQNPCSKLLFSRPLKILFLENDKTIQTIFKYFFEEICDCVLEQVYHLNTVYTYQKTRYDIVFVKQYFPEGDSLCFIKEYHKKHPLVPIVVFTTWITDEEKLLQAGASAILFYPLTAQELKKLLERYIVPDK